MWDTACNWARRSDFNLCQVLDVAYLLVGVLCTFLGGAGYYMYGNTARDVITFNLPKVCPCAQCKLS